MEHPLVKNILDHSMNVVAQKFDHYGDQLVGRLDRYVQAFILQQQAKQQAPPPKPSKEDPRIILGFSPELKLTAEIVKKRKRTLAQLFHPDKDGNKEGLQRINEAADQLLKDLGVK